jgi:hypothetical protein
LPLRPELIADAEITTAQDDALGHEQLTAELLQLIVEAKTPSNVALYGPWGAGKSGIGHLLAAEIKTHQAKDLLFVRFDAFKYARNPLRRNFISVVAKELGSKDSRFGEDLYETTTKSKVKFPVWKVLQLLLVLVGSVFAIAAALALLIAGFAILNDQPVWPALQAAAGLTIPASLVPASLVTAVVAVANKAFVTTHSSERAESDEEFERLFRQLVQSKVRNRKLVVFVDELDRCAPSDVIDTLDSIRTFFGVPGCVFVVAADQQVLDHAMTLALRQATPLDDVNPYYSAGGSYLDKVFQYQLTVPPLRSSSVTAFAATLVADRDGVWQQLNTATIASILIPAHVKAPRRVKHLLNSFVLAHRLASARIASGGLALTLGQTEAEALARLTCLQVEFPLFARDMIIDPDLPQHLVGAKAQPEGYWSEHPGVEHRIKKLVNDYIDKTRSSGAIVAGEDDQQDEIEAIQETQSDQLLSYLQRTSNIVGPYRDLLFLESAGVASNLPGTVAEQLEVAARNSALNDLAGLVAQLDADDRVAGVHFLTQVLRTAVGIEAPNVTRSILLAASMSTLDPPAADAVALEIDQDDVFPDSVLTSATLEGVLRIAASASEARRVSLVRRIAASDVASETDLGARIAIDYQHVLDSEPELVPRALTDRLVSDTAERFAAALEEVEPTALADALVASEHDLAGAIQGRFEAIDTFDAEQEPAATARAARRAEAEPTAERTRPLDPAGILEALHSIATLQATRADQPALLPIVRVLLLVNRSQAEAVAMQILPLVQHPIDADLAELLLRAGVEREPSEWSHWVAPLLQYPDAISEKIRPHLERMLQRLWWRRFSVESPGASSDFEAGARLVSQCAEHLPEEDRALLSARAVWLPSAVTTAEDVDTLREELDCIGSLRRLEILQPVHAASAQRSLLINSVSTDVDDDEIDEVTNGIRRLLHGALASDGAPKSSVLDEIASVIADSDWLPSTAKLEMRNILLASNLTWAKANPELELTPNDFAAVVHGARQRRWDIARDWLRYTTSDPTETAGALAPLLPNAESASELLQALQGWAVALPTPAREQIITTLIGQAGAPSLSVRVLAALGISSLPDARIASLLADRYSEETTIDGRKQVLTIWRAAAVRAEQPRKALVRQVLLDMLQRNQGSAEAAIDAAPFVARPVPSGTRVELRDALTAAGTRFSSLRKRADKTANDLGLPKPKRFKIR